MVVLRCHQEPPPSADKDVIYGVVSLLHKSGVSRFPVAQFGATYWTFVAAVAEASIANADMDLLTALVEGIHCVLIGQIGETSVNTFLIFQLLFCALWVF